MNPENSEQKIIEFPACLYDKITDFQMNLGMFAELCELMYFTKNSSLDNEVNAKYSATAMWYTWRESIRLGEMSDDIFSDMAKLGYWV